MPHTTNTARTPTNFFVLLWHQGQLPSSTLVSYVLYIPNPPHTALLYPPTYTTLHTLLHEYHQVAAAAAVVAAAAVGSGIA